MTRWASLPIRGRLTVAFAASMAVVIGGLSVFVFLRMGSDLLDTIDAGLRSRAELLVSDIQHRGPALANVKPTLIESDEVFAQIADTSGRILQSSSIIARQRLLPAAAVRSVGVAGKAGYADRRLAGTDGEARVLAVPVTTARGRFVVMVGTSLQDRQEELACARRHPRARRDRRDLPHLAWHLAGGHRCTSPGGENAPAGRGDLGVGSGPAIASLRRQR
jgi:hypothetical protein